VDTYVAKNIVLVEKMVDSMVEVLRVSRVETDRPKLLKLRKVETERAVEVLKMTRTPSAELAERAG
jgi:hypothetical protein